MSVSSSKNTDAIVAAALELFKSEGYAAVSVSDICRAANVPRSSFYSIFSGKDEIITHVMRSLKGDQQSMLTELLSAKNDLDRIWTLYDRYLSLAMDFGTSSRGRCSRWSCRSPWDFSSCTIPSTNGSPCS